MESSLCKWFDHQISANSSSGRPSESGASMYGFFIILFKSSDSPLSKKASNSCASCCSFPAKLSLNFPMASLKDFGVSDGASTGVEDLFGLLFIRDPFFLLSYFFHKLCTSTANACASRPSWPSGLVVLISRRYDFDVK